MADLTRPNTPEPALQEPPVDVYRNLFEAANSSRPAAAASGQPKVSSAERTPTTNVQLETSLAERPQPATQPTVAIQNPTSANEPEPAPTEAVAIPEKREVGQESNVVPSEPGPISHMGPCEPGAYLFGCPYFPNQSGARTICGVDCGSRGGPCCATWNNTRPIPWSLFGPGEYIGPPRIEHVSTYYLRVNDLLT
ncbi:MAG TPA: hypothetical protein VFW73_10455, partial [Lacipirellulaceae bacterium]|nr:hypothetical protein [Lacipirellulaceae bacterium]